MSSESREMMALCQVSIEGDGLHMWRDSYEYTE
jgi:hypothetical protein